MLHLHLKSSVLVLVCTHVTIQTIKVFGFNVEISPRWRYPATSFTYHFIYNKNTIASIVIQCIPCSSLLHMSKNWPGIQTMKIHRNYDNFKTKLYFNNKNCFYNTSVVFYSVQSCTQCRSCHCDFLGHCPE